MLPPLFLAVAAAVGLLLRFHQVHFIERITFSNLLHAHSHTMFLGWVLNTIIIAFCVEFGSAGFEHIYKRILVLQQVLIILMLVSFMTTGYSTVSIILSSSHTVATYVFIYFFFSDTRGQKFPALLMARTALWFYLSATVGPYVLAILKSHGLGDTPYYYGALYYYLHFEYNGCFLFAVYSLLISVLERKGVAINFRLAKQYHLLMTIGCIMTFPLSLVWLKLTIWNSVIGSVGAFVQVVGLLGLLRRAYEIPHVFEKLSWGLRTILTVALLSLVFKCLLQLASGFEVASMFAYHHRPVMMAYLHLVLIGSISFSLIFWLSDITNRNVPFSLGATLAVGFLGIEVVMVLQGFWSLSIMPILLFLSSLVLLIGFIWQAMVFSRTAHF